MTIYLIYQPNMDSETAFSREVFINRAQLSLITNVVPVPLNDRFRLIDGDFQDS